MADKIAIPTETVTSAAGQNIELAQTVVANADHSMIGIFMEADIVVKLVILMLLLASLWSWTIIFDKLYKFFTFNKRMDKFEATIWDGESLEQRFKRTKNNPDHPLASVFVSGMYEWQEIRQSGQFSGIQPSLLPNGQVAGKGLDETLKTNLKDRVLHAMDSMRNREISAMEYNTGFLATVGSTAPFIGLFGTVWGIMDSFQSIAMTKNTTLAVVAPGIAEALFATAIGLFAAIPAVIFYNKLSNEIAGFSDRVDDFIDEFITVVSRELDSYTLASPRSTNRPTAKPAQTRSTPESSAQQSFIG